MNQPLPFQLIPGEVLAIQCNGMGRCQPYGDRSAINAARRRDIGYHLFWRSKYRRAVLTGSIAAPWSALIRDKATENNWQVIALEVMPDHVQLFVKTHPTDSQSSHVANRFKGVTSRVLRDGFAPEVPAADSVGSRSYFVATVGAVYASTVQRYIDTHYERPWWKGYRSEAFL